MRIAKVLGPIVVAGICLLGLAAISQAQTAPVDFTKDIQPIFTANCVGCHGGASPSAGMSLEAGKAFDSLKTRVVAGNPAQSTLVARLEGTSGARMPFGGDPLPTATIALVKRWITEGVLAAAPAQTSPSISLSATSLAFDSTKVGANSQKTLTISNTGTAALTITSLRSLGADSTQFAASPASGTVDAGKTLAVTVTFAPTSAGRKSASLSIAHNATGSPSTVALSGTGVAATQPPAVPSDVPEASKQDTTKLGVWLDLNPADGNQFVMSKAILPGTEVTVQVFGRNLTSASGYGFTLTFDATVLTFVTDPAKSKIGDYMSGISLSPQVTAGSVQFGTSTLPPSPKSGSGWLGTAVFKVSDKFTSGYTEIKVSQLKLGTATATIQPSNAILYALKNASPVARFAMKPDAIKAGDRGLVTLDASSSSDADGDPITFAWTVKGVVYKKSTADTSRVAMIQLADTTKSNVPILLTVTDSKGAKGTARDTLRVISPPSPSSAVTMDLNPADGDQGADLQYDANPGDIVTLQVFVKDLSGVTGYTAHVEYDTTRLQSVAYTNGPLISGTFIPLSKLGNGYVEGGGSTLPAKANSGSGLLATFTFKVKDGFQESTTLRVTSINLQAGTTRNEMIKTPFEALITADPLTKAAPAASFDDDGDVDFDDFFAFALQFNTKAGDPGWNPVFDLTGDGVVDFEDFFAFALMFGLVEN